MRKIALAVLAAVLPVVALASPSDHAVTAPARDERLRAAAADRNADIASVEALLATPAARNAAAAIGADISDVRAGAATLSNAELRDVAARARALRADPAAGLSHDVNELLVIFLIVAIVILVLKSV